MQLQNSEKVCQKHALVNTRQPLGQNFYKQNIVMLEMKINFKSDCDYEAGKEADHFGYLLT